MWLTPSEGQSNGITRPRVPDDGDFGAVDGSPDGTRIAFSFGRARDPGFDGLYVLSSTGRLLKHFAGADDPTWSLNSSHVAFEGGDGHIWTADRDGGQARVLTARLLGQGPQWSPDGSVIAFRAGPYLRQRIWIISAHGGVPRRIAPDKVSDIAW
jgi:Tol biopolymer transport system component